MTICRGGAPPTQATYQIKLVDRSTGGVVEGCDIQGGGVQFEFFRTLNEVSEAILILNTEDTDCKVICDCIPAARQHELVFFRSDRPTEAAWVGVVTRVVEDPAVGTVTIQAKDRFYWVTGAQATRRFVESDYGQLDRNNELSPVLEFAAILDDANRYMPNGLRYPPTLPVDRGLINIRPDTIEKGESLWFYGENLVSAYIDFTVVGEQLYWGAPEVGLVDGLDLRSSQNWINGAVSVDIDGEQAASQVRVEGASGIVATYPAEDVDRGFGRRTLFVADTEVSTQVEADNLARFIFERNFEPATFLITGDGSLGPNTDLALHEIIPGRKHLITADAGCQTSVERRRITAVAVSGRSAIGPGGYQLVEERVAVDFQPPGTEANPQQVTS